MALTPIQVLELIFFCIPSCVIVRMSFNCHLLPIALSGFLPPNLLLQVSALSASGKVCSPSNLAGREGQSKYISSMSKVSEL